MKNTEFENYVEVFKYLYDRDYTDLTFSNIDSLRIGLLEWSSLTGEAQNILRSSFPKKMTDVQTEFWTKFVEADNIIGTSWITKAPVTISGALTSKYAETFEGLLTKSIPTQREEINKLEEKWVSLCNLLKITEPAHKVLALVRIIMDPLKPKELEHLIFLSQKNINAMLEELNVDARSLTVLSGNIRHLPGKSLNPWKEFPWLVIKETVNVSE